MGFFSNIFGGGKSKKINAPEAPAWYEDAFYKPTQDLLFGEGKNYLSGNINEYYKPIGEFGGKEFEDVLAMKNRDISVASTDDSVRRGMGRGGVAASSMAKAIGDSSKELRWADFLRAMEGRKGFLQLGNSMVSGVRDAGLTYQSQKNSFNAGIYNTQVGIATNQAELDQSQSNANSQAQGDFFGSLISGGMSLFGMNKYLDAAKAATTPNVSSKIDAGSADPFSSGRKRLTYEYPY
jgi:hypothetical protein